MPASARRSVFDGQILTAYDKPKDLFLFPIESGVRLGEALSIQWSDIDLSDRELTVWNQKTSVETWVPISVRFAENLHKRHNQKAPFENMGRAVRVLRKVIDQVCNTNDRINKTKGKATTHTLRDTYATRLDEAGVSLLQIRDLLGHAPVTKTQKYARGEARKAVETAKRVLDGQTAQNCRGRKPLYRGNPPDVPQDIDFLCFFGALGRIRTPDPLIRSQVLYPTELPAHAAVS